MTLSAQFLTMLAMIGMGSAFGASLDTYNRFLRRAKRKSWIVFINDFLFWSLQGLAVFYVLFVINQGELRFYIFIALLCGFAAYQSLLKQGFLRLLETLIEAIAAIFRFFVRMAHLLIYKPIQTIVMGIISLILMLGKGILALLKLALRIIWTLLKVILSPVKWIWSLFWLILPKKIKNLVEKLYNKLAGNLHTFKNNLNSLLTRWKNK
jgi:spore cortex biosynthesis protein YabQ